ncbi:MAG: hypothetical protein ACRD18_17160, partial [Terriglobia bacterium]
MRGSHAGVNLGATARRSNLAWACYNAARFRQSGCGIEWGNGGGEQELECGDVFWGDILRQGTSKDRDD